MNPLTRVNVRRALFYIEKRLKPPVRGWMSHKDDGRLTDEISDMLFDVGQNGMLVDYDIVVDKTGVLLFLQMQHGGPWLELTVECTLV